MPRIELTDVCGTQYRFDSTDYDLIRAWLDEWLPRLRNPHDEVRINFWPLFTFDGQNQCPDWICDNRLLGYREPFPAADGAAGVDWIRQHHASLLARQRDLERQQPASPAAG